MGQEAWALTDLLSFEGRPTISRTAQGLARRDGMKNRRILGILLGCWALMGPLPVRGLAEESAPTIRYRERLEQLRRTRPRAEAAEEKPTTPTDGPRPLDYIDAMVSEAWKEIKATPSEPATDGEFVRRSALDLLGRIPTLEETKSFLNSRSSDKREAWIDRCLESPEFGTNLANVWIKLLMPPEVTAQDANRDALHAWLEREFNRNRPWNEMVRDLLTAEGRWDEHPETNFLLATQEDGNSIRTTSMVTKLFLGVQTQCTECHDHPWNSWKQDQFHGMNAFFLGTRERRSTRPQGGNSVTDYWTLEELPFEQVAMKGVFFERRNGLSVFTGPTYLDGRDIQKLAGIKTTSDDVRDYLRRDSEQGPSVRLREQLALAITAADNPYFARTMVNRMWYHFLGHAFTKNVDDFDNGLDEPTMPELLDRLAADFRANNYDIKGLARWIANTKAYALSSKRKAKKSEESLGFFAYQLVRPLSPEQLYDSLLTLTRIDETSKDANAGAERRAFIDAMLRTFGTDAIPTAAPTYDGTITQSLMLMNSPLMARLTSCVPGSSLHSLVFDKKMNDKDRIDAIYLTALSRRPTSAESKVVSAMLLDAGDEKRPEVFADVLWAIINSAEFVLNH
jgi:hypothetical protein